MAEDMRWDPTIEDVPDDPPTGGGSVRTRQKPQKSEQKLRTNGWSIGSFHGWLASSRQGQHDEDYAEVGAIDGRGRGGRAEIDVEHGNAELNVADAQVRVAAARGVMVPGDAIEYQPVATRFEAPGPFAARVSDPTVHGVPLGPGIGSTNVIIGGLPAFRARLDYCVCPAATPTPHVGGMAPFGANTVLVNGFPLVRAGDVIVEPCGGPNPVMMGCASVMAGPPVPPIDLIEHVAHQRDLSLHLGDLVEVRLDGPITGEVGVAEGSVKLGAKADLAEKEAGGRAKVEGMVGLARVSGSGEIVVHIPLVDKAFRIGGRGSAVLGCAGGDFDVGLAREDGRFKPSGGVPKLGVQPVCTDSEISWGLFDDPGEE